MRSMIHHFLMFIAIISLSACASTEKPNENYLDAGARQHIKSVDAVLFTKQDKIGADIKQNPTLTKVGALSAGFTILPTLLDVGVTGVRTINANKLAKPVREKLEDHDFAFEFTKQIRQSLDGTTLDGVENIKVVRSEYPGLRGLMIAESEADAVLTVDMKYAFTPNFESLYVRSFAMLFPNRPELKQFQEVPDKDSLIEFSDNIYRNQYAVAFSTKLEDATAAEHAAFWSDLSEEQLVELLEIAALTMSDTIANDIAIDDVESDLNLIPEGYVLNTKYDNFNRSFAKLRNLDEVMDEVPDVTDAAADTDTDVNPEEEIKATVGDVKTSS